MSQKNKIKSIIFYFNTCTVHLLLYVYYMFIITTQRTINIITVYIITVVIYTVMILIFNLLIIIKIKNNYIYYVLVTLCTDVCLNKLGC